MIANRDMFVVPPARKAGRRPGKSTNHQQPAAEMPVKRNHYSYLITYRLFYDVVGGCPRTLMLVAETEVLARQNFRNRHPHADIVQIECLGLYEFKLGS
jgi:hypothetical protein